MSNWTERLTTRLEPIRESADLRPAISAYHDMPFAIVQYPAIDEFAPPG